MPRKRVVGRRIKTTLCEFLLADVENEKIETARQELIGHFTKNEINQGIGDKLLSGPGKKFIYCKEVILQEDYYYLSISEFYKLAKREIRKGETKHENNNICEKESNKRR